VFSALRSASHFGLLLLLVAGLAMVGCDGGGSGPPEPQISGLQPSSGPPSTVVTINGSGFGADASAVSVTFDGQSAPVNSAGESSIEAEVPSGLSSGAAPVEVTVGEQTASGPDFTVEQAAPGISSVQPDSGTVGTAVTIEGMNFSATASENTITFAGTQAPVNGAATDQLKTEVPSGAADGPIEVTVKQKSTTGPDFNVITEGTMEVVTTTSGDDQDPDGYTITVDGSASKSASKSDTTYFGGLSEGSHDAELSDLADNCSVSGSNPRSVSIAAGDTASTTFDVSCQTVANNKVVFRSDRDGDNEIFLMNADGSGPTQLTDNTAWDAYAKVSNDGTKIAFVSDRDGNADLYVMDADGANVRQVTSSSGSTLYFSWSPDDTKIAFSDDRSGNYDIYTIGADGSGEQRLTNDSATDYTPNWSPGGSSIAFTSDRDGDEEIYTMNPDGTGLTQITGDTDNNGIPRWSPDGSEFAFVSNRDGNYEVYTMNADGTGVQRVTNNSDYDGFPAWSPDGAELVFQTDRDGNDEAYKINADGSGTPVNLTADSATDRAPHWSPVQ
jgi:hypothetical protein